jgi:hypothetical protein
MPQNRPSAGANFKTLVMLFPEQVHRTCPPRGLRGDTIQVGRNHKTSHAGLQLHEIGKVPGPLGTFKDRGSS